MIYQRFITIQIATNCSHHDSCAPHCKRLVQNHSIWQKTFGTRTALLLGFRFVCESLDASAFLVIAARGYRLLFASARHIDLSNFSPFFSKTHRTVQAIFACFGAIHKTADTFPLFFSARQRPVEAFSALFFQQDLNGQMFCLHSQHKIQHCRSVSLRQH